MAELDNFDLRDHQPPGTTENLINRDSSTEGMPTTPDLGLNGNQFGIGQNPPGSGGETFQDMWNTALATGTSTKFDPLSLNSFSNNARYSKGTRPGDDWEEGYAQNQGWGSKMVNGVAKGVSLAGTTFLQTTVGTAYGLTKMYQDKRLASFYDNDLNRSLDEFNKRLEDQLPHFYTHAEKDARWYSPTKLVSANFLWDGIVKNLGFAAGAAASGWAFTAGLKAIPLSARAMTTGKAGEAFLKAEKAIEKGIQASEGIGAITAVNDAYLAASSGYNSLNVAQRGLVAALSTTGEAGFEAYHNLNDFRDNEIQKYKDSHSGRSPEGAALADINAASESIGNVSALFNIILLTGTNYIQFPKILGSSYKAEKGAMNAATRQIKDVVTDASGKFITKASTQNPIYRTFNRVRPYLFSASEAFEEGSQFAISKGVEDYYNKKLNNQTASILESMVEGIRTTLGTDEGMENILIGGLSGSIMLGVGKYRKNSELNENTAEALRDGKFQNTGLNSAKLSDFQKDTFDSVSRAAAIDAQRVEKIAEDNVIDTKDLDADYIINYLTPRIKHGRYDLVKNDIKEQREVASTEAGFNQLKAESKVNEKDTREAYLARLNRFEVVAEKVKGYYESTNLRFGGAVDQEGNKLYSDAVLDKMVYALAKIDDYDIRIPEVKMGLVATATNIDEIIAQSLSGVNTLLKETEKAIKADDNITETDQENTIRNLYDVVNLSIRRRNMIKAYNEIKNNPIKFTPIEPTVSDAEEGKEVIVKVTKKGKKIDKTLTVGETYYHIPPTSYDDAGNASVREPMELTIIGTNNDGTIRVKDKIGNVSNIAPEDFADYNMGTVDETKNNVKAKYALDNLNDEYIHQGLDEWGARRKGNTKEAAKGWLEYSYVDDKLMFVLRTPKGTVKRIEVSNEDFKARTGYKVPMIKRTKINLSREQKKSEKALLNSKSSMSEKQEKRKAILQEVVDNNLKEVEKKFKELETLKTTLANIADEISKAPYTKTGTPRKSIKAVKRLIDKLQEQKESIPLEIERLEAEIPQMQAQQFILENLISGIATAQESDVDLLASMKQDIKDFDTLIKNSNQAIEDNKKRLTIVEKLLQRAVKLLNDFITKLRAANPGIPLNFDTFQNNLEKYLGDVGAASFIQDKLGFTNQVLELENQILSYKETINFPKLESLSENIIKTIKEHERVLEDSIAEKEATLIILDKFEVYVEKELEKEKAQEILKDNPLILKTLRSTQDTDDESVNFDPETPYVASKKKAAHIIPIASIGINDGKRHQERANIFGFNLPKIKKEKENIRGVYVTQDTEGDLGLTGLAALLAEDSEGKQKVGVDPTTTIMTVMVVEDENGDFIPVDVEGNPITEGNLLEQAIFQVHPLEELRWLPTTEQKKKNEPGDTMFREGTSDTVIEETTKKYKTWRAKILDRKEVKYSFEPDSSFGFLSYERDNDGAINWEQRTSVKAAGFLDEKDDTLLTKKYIFIPTVQDEVEKGTTHFSSPYKRILLETENGYTALQNQKHSKEQATSIFKAILALSKEFVDEGSEKLKSKKAKRLLSYLKGVVYWGTPNNKNKQGKTVGYNSVFFESDNAGNQILFIGRDPNNTFVFTPTDLKLEADNIIEALQTLYTNTSNNLVKRLNSSFEEITDISEDGVIQSRMWPNYQTYLLSDKAPNDSGDLTINRPGKNIPLTTAANPITEQKPVNRTGIYFYNSEATEEYKIAPPEQPSEKGSKNVNFKDNVKSEKISEKDIRAVVDAEGVKEALLTKMPELKNWTLDDYKKGFVYLTSIKLANISVPSSPQGDEVTQKNKKLFVEALEKQLSEHSLDKQVQAVATAYKTESNKLESQYSFADAESGLEVDTENILSTNEEEGGVKRFDWSKATPKGKKETKVNEEPAENTYSTEPDEDTGIPEEPGTSGPSSRGRILDDIDDDEDNNLFKRAFDNRIPAQGEDWKKAKKFLKKKLGNFPVFRLDNIIENGGKYAWGLFQDNAIYIWEHAELGTIYHEVFEAVWKTFTNEEEQRVILNEFKSRDGKFFDRVTRKEILFSEASDYQAKEALADEFRDFILEKPSPYSLKGILKFFKELWQAIKETVGLSPRDKSEINKLFNSIDKGTYRNRPVDTKKLSFNNAGWQSLNKVEVTNGEFSKLPDLSETEKDQIVVHLMYKTLSRFLSDDKNLFSIDPMKINDAMLMAEVNDVFDRYQASMSRFYTKEIDKAETKKGKDELTSEFKREKAIHENKRKAVKEEFFKIKSMFVSKMRSFDVVLDEQSEEILRSEEKTRNSDYINSTMIDHARKMNGALKLMLSTVVRMNENGKRIPSSIGGVQVLPFGEVRNTLMKTLSSSRTPSEMIERLRKLATEDPNYRTLYSRFTRAPYDVPNVGFSKIKSTQSFRLISGLWKNFSLHSPTVKNVFIFSDGTVEVGDATLSNESQQLKDNFLNKIIVNAKTGKGYFKYSKLAGGTYEVNKLLVRNAKLQPQNPQTYVTFLNKVGIEFTLEDIQKLKEADLYPKFQEIVSGFKKSLSEAGTIKSFNTKDLQLTKRLFSIALFKARISNPAFQSTYFNVQGERAQTHIGGNTPSRLYKVLSQIKNIKELEGTEFDYLIFNKNPETGEREYKDAFVEGSVVLEQLFDNDGDIKESALKDITEGIEHNLAEVGFVGGILDDAKGRRTSSSRLKLKFRFLQELNLNLKGWYLNLVPGDSSTEWMTYLGNVVDELSLEKGYADVHKIFRKYFIAEYNLSRDDRPVHRDRSARELRFFGDILSRETLRSVNRSKAKEGSFVYKNNQAAIEKDIEQYIKNQKTKLREQLEIFDIMTYDAADEKFYFENLDTTAATASEVDTMLDKLTINYMIANTEMHKLVYGDPFQYIDELKRTKSFQSPRQEIMNSDLAINELKDKIWNKNFKRGTLGWTNFSRDYFRTITYSDVRAFNELFPEYGMMKETDGGGIIALKAYRHFKLNSSDWTDDNEKQYQYEIEWERLDKLNTKESLKKRDALVNPRIRSTFTALKPIVSGNRRHDEDYNLTVLDKYSLYPISYRIMKQTNARNGMRLQQKMDKEDIDYIIFESGRKVGAYSTYPAYEDGGRFNNKPYSEEEVIEIPFSIMGLQVEVPSKDEYSTPKGSQVTKMITMDRMSNGVPLDFLPEETEPRRFKEWWELEDAEKAEQSKLYKEILNNKKLLIAQLDWGYHVLTKKLGFVKNSEGEMEIKDVDKTIELIKKEVLSRETTDNIISALNSYKTSTDVLEATPAYRQISNVLYSIVDKNVLKGKITGAQKVQIPSTFWENNKMAIQDFNGKQGYTSEVLNFYSEGRLNEETGEVENTNVMEIFASRWFKSDMSDDDLLEFLNKTPEGQKILSGFAYRIPTQNMNSIDAFKIKRFLPAEFGDNVVVPAALVGKVGSDFDIDKLTMYLKAVYTNLKGLPEQIPFFGIGEEGVAKATDLARKLVERTIKKRITKEENLFNKFSDVVVGNVSDAEYKKYINIFKEIYEEEILNDPEFAVQNILENFILEIERLDKKLEDVTNKDVIDVLVETKAENLYKKGLQNEYVESNIKLLTHPTNFKKLTSPNSAETFKQLAKKINKKLGNEDVNYTKVGNMMDRTFMTNKRHNFVSGKGIISIAAVSATNLAISQGQVVTVDIDRNSNAPAEEFEYLKANGGGINFNKSKYNYVYHKNRMRPTLSGMFNNDNKSRSYISDVLGMMIDGAVDVANDSWIIEMGATPETAGTWLFLFKLGLPIEDVAFFMNQPIIKDYMQMIENKGYGWLFIDDFRDDLQALKYGSSAEFAEKEIPNKTTLWNSIGQTEFSDEEKAMQRFYLDEFLKYSMMARHLYYFTQGTNYDTANFNNPYLLDKKEMQYERAKNSIIGGVDEVMDNTFLGATKNNLEKSREVIAKVMTSDKPNVRSVVREVLKEYVDLPDREYVKMAQRVITSLFDWAMQTHYELTDDIERVLINEGNTAQELASFIRKIKADKYHDLHNNYIIQAAEIMPAKTAESGSTDNVKIKLASSEVYDKNKLTYAFMELRHWLSETDNFQLYNNLVTLAFLQNGLTASTMSFTEHLPFEDFQTVYKEPIRLLETKADIRKFVTSNAFARNNWSNNNAVSYFQAPFIPGINIYNPGMVFIKRNNPKMAKAINNGELPNIVTIKTTQRPTETIVYTWEEDIASLSDSEIAAAAREKISPLDFLKKKKEVMRSAGDFSFKNKGLFQRVLKADGTPKVHKVVNQYGETSTYYVYKGINAWGNSNRAAEYYDVARPSKINNGFVKVDNEVDDQRVLSYFDLTTPYKPKTFKKRTKKTSKAGDSLSPFWSTNDMDITKEELLEDYDQSTGLPMGEIVKTSEIATPDKTMVLKGGKTYKHSEIDGRLLLSLGYTEKQAGNILEKIICKST